MMWCPSWGGTLGGQGFGTFGTWGIATMIFNLLMLLLIVLVTILLFRWAFRRLSPSTGLGAGLSKSMEILQERYAKGEISKDQYEQMKKDVGG